MRLKTWIAASALLAWAPPLPAQADPPIHGRFLVRYQPIYCRMAPCGRGVYTVEMVGQRLATVKRVLVDASTPSAQRQFIAGFVWDSEPLAVEGSATVSDDSVTLHADRAIEGEWKP